MKKIKNILILAGGDGTRFWPLENKNLVSFLSKPLLKHIVEKLIPFSDNLFVVGTQKVKTELDANIKFIQQNEKLPQSQASAILSAKDALKGEVFILNANDILDFKIIKPFISKIIAKKLEYALVSKKIKNYFPGGYLKIYKKKLTGIVEKPDPDKVPSDLVLLDVNYFADFSKLISMIESNYDSRDDLYEVVMDKSINLLKSDYLKYEGFWYTIKYPWHILPMMQYFLSTLKQTKIGRNVKISNTAKIIGPAFIDDNTIIGDFTMIRQSHIGKNCVIGGYSEVTRSYLSDGVMLHRNYVGDSILDKNVSMGAGAVTANYRFDAKSVISVVNNSKVDTQLAKLGTIIGQNCRIGVNAAILPGIKIGKNTFIGPAELVDQDLEEELFVFKGKKVKNKLVV